MITSINIRSSVAVYVQIENQVQFAIASGRLKPGDQLPSVREMSERVGVNPNTIAKAYRDLEVMGYLYTRRGMGVYIGKGVDSKCREDCRKSIVSHLHEVIAEAKAAGIEPEELKRIVQKCLAVDSAPYDETPREILSLAKSRASRT